MSEKLYLIIFNPKLENPTKKQIAEAVRNNNALIQSIESGTTRDFTLPTGQLRISLEITDNVPSAVLTYLSPTDTRINMPHGKNFDFPPEHTGRFEMKGKNAVVLFESFKNDVTTVYASAVLAPDPRKVRRK